MHISLLTSNMGHDDDNNNNGNNNNENNNNNNENNTNIDDNKNWQGHFVNNLIIAKITGPQRQENGMVIPGKCSLFTMSVAKGPLKRTTFSQG